MKNQIYRLLFVLCCLPLAACDLHDKILIKDDPQPIIVANDASEYIQSTSPDDYTQYASDSDYVMPAQSVVQKNRADQTQQQKIQAPQPEPKIQDPQPEPKIQAPQPAAVITQPQSEPDDILLVPARVVHDAPKPVMVPPVASEIIVKKGDTLYSLSKNNGIALRDLVDANNLSAPFAISVGQRLKIPSAKVHIVAASETLYSISRRYSVDLNSLATENKIAAPYSLAVGQRLRLPAKVHISAPVGQQPIIISRQPTARGPQPAAVSQQKSVVSPQQSTLTGPKLIAEKQRVSSAPARPLPTIVAQKRMAFTWPARGKILSDFGYKKNGLYNDGINIGAASGTSVKAAESGIVAYAGNELKGMGNLLIVQHANGWMSVYAHLDEMNVRRSSKVAKGEKIGTIGKTGKVSEPQLHFEIRKGTKAYDPQKELK